MSLFHGDEAVLEAAKARAGKGGRPVLKHWRKAVALDTWCLRLSFPFLTKNEILGIRRSNRPKWRWLFGERFGIDPDQLSQRASRKRESPTDTSA